MATPYIGEIRTVGFPFAPVGWLPCDGSLQAISNYEPLFYVIGTTYGGDGQNTFALPNLQSRIVPGAQAGQPGPGLSTYQPGQTGGSENVTLIATQLPPHTHPFSSPIGATTAGTASNTPAANLPGPSSAALYSDTATAGRNLAANAVTGQTQGAGSSQSHPNIQPVLALNYIICTEGIFPPQP
ncbi:tail fiber protein [Hymenobacter sp. BT635]|uniref:Tail fiber protein n=1 Tax=Hymenobacter nitidus TaxID=2880929 RepID=A0ABS8A884_9BACT|nr:tail fiber protein [Hymenobacter nitidus]MCB2376439.1 tail fiber protein [Hymenobacter nitidus]